MSACIVAELPYQDLHIYQGDDYWAEVEVFTPDDIPMNLTGYTTLAQIRSNVADVAATVVAVFASVIEGSVITLSLDKAVTLLLAGRYMWDLEITSSSGLRTTIVKGAVIVVQEVSRP